MSVFPKRPVSQDAVLEALETVATGLGAKIDGVEKRTAEKIVQSEQRTMAKIVESEQRTTAKIEAVDAKVDAVDAKVDAVDAKVDAVDAKVDSLRSEFEGFKQEVRHGFKTMDENFLELNRKFNTLIALIGAKPAE